MIRNLIRKENKLISGLTLICLIFVSFGYVTLLAAAPDDIRVAELTKGAEKEGKLVFLHSYTVGDAEVVVRKFQKKYPFIKVEAIHLNNPQIINRVLAEQRAKKITADVINSKGDAICFMQKIGLLAKYSSPERKYYADRFKDKEGYWTDIYLTVHSVAYNTRTVAPAEVPTSYQDLLKPRWKGRIGFNPLQYMWAEAVMQIMGREEGLKYLEALARQNPVVRTGGPLNVMLTAAGEVDMSLPINSNNVESAKAQGAPVDRAKIKPYYGDLHPIALAANAPHSNAGKLFIDYFLSQECQELSAQFMKISSRTGVKSTIVRSEDIIPIDPTLEKTEYYQKLLRRIFIGKT